MIVIIQKNQLLVSGWGVASIWVLDPPEKAEPFFGRLLSDRFKKLFLSKYSQVSERFVRDHTFILEFFSVWHLIAIY